MTDFMDVAEMAEMFARPGQDTRQWCSYGIVQPDPSGSEHSVRFNDDDGNPLPHGVLVDVKLEPSGITVPCRVLMRTAGKGEAEWDPMGPGDEVLVAIPEGDERAGCCILGRLNNSKDVFPTVIAGQDVTKNNMVVRRYQAPFILESGNSLQVRVAKTGAQLTMLGSGEMFLNDGNRNMLYMGASAITLMSGDQALGLQLDFGALQTKLVATSASFTLDQDLTILQTAGSVQIQTAGGGAGGNAITVQQVCGLIANVICAMGQTVPPLLNPAASITPAILTAVFAAAIPGTVLPNAVGLAGAPGGALDALGLPALILAALLNPVPDPAAFGLISPVFPGLAKPGLMF